MLIRVYYEDTDAAGVVYHSNYLNYCERARTEYLRERGHSVAALAADGAVLPVVRMEIDFRLPARHDDLLRVLTVPVRVGGSSFTLRQQIRRDHDDHLLVELLVTLACVTPELKARRIPAAIRELLAAEVAAC
ncbi:YbgC/FadM family acyl-CoA thioesterase [Trichlorobacter ammonificans]|uniref:Acyl-CoA thioester hydrolase YbgC n=1 Tax=Trichlorobacter ammonificans TaxID=2916410 RepID=A0ABM9DBV7_9BACT|nr:YbgC/FadM family acyl-CoA thioesterase [Trichlorobacter ammonificans]CAH2032709.1 Acyl-CoA thioester hydrolase YbgC [Trichlorobacter ammonificans]